MSGRSAGGRSPAGSRLCSLAGSRSGSRSGSRMGSYAGSHSSGSRSHSPARPAACLAGQRHLLLRQSLAITLRRTGSVPPPAPPRPPDDAHPADGDAATPASDLVDNDFWMYDNGYLLFQGFVEANARCFWSAALLEAMRELSFEGYVSPGVLLVRAGACALDVVRAAWSRRVLKPPPNYVIADVGDIEDCCVLAVPQSQFTPLPEALCWVILELTSTGQAAVLPAVLRTLPRAFPAMTRPEASVVYDTLAKLSAERKVYQTARGYFLVTPETRRRLASMQPGARRGRRSMLLSNEEALVMVHGDMQTERDGHRTHQCIQTNLADVICGGNPEDKVLYARGRALERRHSLRLSTRLGQALQRAGSLRSLPPRPPPTSPATPPASPWASPPASPPEKKQSLLTRLFRRSTRPRGPRARRGQSAPPSSSTREHASSGPEIRTFAAQFPAEADDAERHPADWFNPSVTPLTSVGTQTQPPSPVPTSHSVRSSSVRSASSPAADRWDSSCRASTLPRSLSRSSPRRARRLSDSLSLSVSRAASPASQASHASHAPTTASSSLGPLTSTPPCAPTSARKPSPCGTLLSSSSSRASRVSATSQASKVSSGYNSSGTRSGSPAGRRSLPTPTKSPFTLLGSPSPACSAPTSARHTTSTTTTINGNNTRVYVQQHNSPVRSVITIENRAGGEHAELSLLTRHRGPILETSFDRTFPAAPSSCNLTTVSSTATTTTTTTTTTCSGPPAPSASQEADRYSSNKINNHNLSGKAASSTSSSSSVSSEESLTSAGSLVTKEAEMNNSRKMSLTSPTTPAGFLRESLSYKNILKEVQNYSGPAGQVTGPLSASPYASMASLSDLSVHCKSLAAQRILSGVSINSVDTLVEVNMAAGLAAEKTANCTIRTDFGVV